MQALVFIDWGLINYWLAQKLIGNILEFCYTGRFNKLHQNACLETWQITNKNDYGQYVALTAPNQTKFVFQSFTSDEHDCTAVHSNIFEPNTIFLQDTAYLEQTSQKIRK